MSPGVSPVPPSEARPGGVERCRPAWPPPLRLRLVPPSEARDSGESSGRCLTPAPASSGDPTHPGESFPRPRSDENRDRRPRPRGSRIDDVTSDRIVRGGMARIERRRIPSRWARTARAGVDSVALSSHYASRPERLFRCGFEGVGREGRGDGLLGRVLLVQRVVAEASGCVGGGRAQRDRSVDRRGRPGRRRGRFRRPVPASPR